MILQIATSRVTRDCCPTEDELWSLYSPSTPLKQDTSHITRLDFGSLDLITKVLLTLHCFRS